MTEKQKITDKLGLIHVISGNGKGKTTSALGLALRAAGHGLKVLVIQFMKKGWNYGEIKSIALIPEIELIQFGTPDFVDKNNPKPIDLEEAKKGLERAQEALKEDWNLLILDELNIAIEWNLISVEEVIALVKSKPENLELVITGRYAHAKLIELADYYSNIEEINHPFQKQVLSRQGIEF